MNKKWVAFVCTMILCLAGFVITAQAREAPVAHYTFDDEANLGADSSGLGNDLLPEGSPVYTASGKIGGAVDLDASSWFVRDYYDDGTATGLAFPTGVPAAPAAGNGSYTLSAWALFDIPGDLNCGIVGWGDWDTNLSNVLRVDPDDGVNVMSNYWYRNDLTVSTASPFKDGKWHLLAATYDEATNTRTLYVDGLTVGSDNPGTGHNMAAMNFSVGATRINRNGGGYAQAHSGLLDDVRVYDRALTQSEIGALVPEPGSLVLLVCGGMMLVFFGQKHR